MIPGTGFILFDDRLLSHIVGTGPGITGGPWNDVVLAIRMGMPPLYTFTSNSWGESGPNTLLEARDGVADYLYIHNGCSTGPTPGYENLYQSYCVDIYNLPIVDNLDGTASMNGYAGGPIQLVYELKFIELKEHFLTYYGDAFGDVSVVYKPGMIGGYAGRFGNNRYLTVEDSTDFTFDGDFTVEFFATSNYAPGTYSSFSNISSSADSFSNSIEIYTSLGYWKVDLYDAAGNKTTIIGGAVQTYQHVAVVRFESMVTIYIHGVPNTGTYWAHTLNAKGLTIGNAYQNSSHGWDGWLNEYLIFKSAVYTSAFTPRTISFFNP